MLPFELLVFRLYWRQNQQAFSSIRNSMGNRVETHHILLLVLLHQPVMNRKYGAICDDLFIIIITHKPI